MSELTNPLESLLAKPAEGAEAKAPEAAVVEEAYEPLQFRLQVDHYINGQILPPGTFVGEGTPYPNVAVGLRMEGVNARSEEAVKLHRKQKKFNPNR